MARRSKENKMKNSLTLVNDEHLKQIGLPKKFWGDISKSIYYGSEATRKSFERYLLKIDDAVSDGIGLYLSGPSGSGKTFYLAIVLKLLAQIPPTTLQYCTMERLTNIYFGKEPELSFENFVKEADFFALDNIDPPNGPQRPTILSNFLRLRADEGKLSFVASTLGIDEMQTHYKTKVADALRDNFFFLRCEVDSFQQSAKLAQRKESFE